MLKEKKNKEDDDETVLQLQRAGLSVWRTQPVGLSAGEEMNGTIHTQSPGSNWAVSIAARWKEMGWTGWGGGGGGGGE